jgi:hypothetical protein
MLKALLPLFALASFLMIGFAVPAPADAGGIVQTGYARNSQIICHRSTICRKRFDPAQAYVSWWWTH